MIEQQYLKDLLHYDPITGIFTRNIVTNVKQRVGETVGTIDNKGYVRIGIDKKYYRAHRLAFLYMTGKFPENQVDHKNTIRTDNSWLNLREATNAQNQYNRMMKNKTGYKGVKLIKGLFVAQIRYKRKKINLGCFKTAKEAGEAYANAATWFAEDFKRLI